MTKTETWIKRRLYGTCHRCLCKTCVYNAAGDHWCWIYEQGTDEVPAVENFCYYCDDSCAEYEIPLMICSNYKKANWYTRKEAEAAARIAEEAANRRRAFRVLSKGRSNENAE